MRNKKRCIHRRHLAAAFLLNAVAAVTDKAPVYAKAAANNGTTATLTCRADGLPAVNFSWSKVRTSLQLLVCVCDMFLLISLSSQ